jgi:hypothetical protein
LALCCTSRSDAVTGSGTEHGTGSGSGIGSALFFDRVGARPLAAGGAVVLQSALDQLDRVAGQLEIGMEVGVHRILLPAVLHHLLLCLHVLAALADQDLQCVHSRCFWNAFHDGGFDACQVADES